MATARFLMLLAAAALAAPAQAVVLYKSVGANGIIEFSDRPPAGDAKLVEQRELGKATPGATSVFLNDSGPARVTSMEALSNDDEVLRASAQVDLAEHALALARRGIWSPLEGLRLKRVVRTTSDEQRIDYYKRGVTLARQNLIDVMKRRASALAVPGAPIVTAVASR